MFLACPDVSPVRGTPERVYFATLGVRFLDGAVGRERLELEKDSGAWKALGVHGWTWGWGKDSGAVEGLGGWGRARGLGKDSGAVEGLGLGMDSGIGDGLRGWGWTRGPGKDSGASKGLGG